MKKIGARKKCERLLRYEEKRRKGYKPVYIRFAEGNAERGSEVYSEQVRRTKDIRS